MFEIVNCIASLPTLSIFLIPYVGKQGEYPCAGMFPAPLSACLLCPDVISLPETRPGGQERDASNAEELNSIW